jgi:hydrogenase expression/formation protein HypE
MGHGSGGRMSQDLISRVFLPHFENPALCLLDDASVVQPGSETRLAVSTDSHVVWPLFFPGGDIGKLAICGTVNDIAMVGAAPLFLTAGFILEEGLDLEILINVVESMKSAAAEAEIRIVAGDTKVVQKGKADGLYINTTGVGIVAPEIHISGSNARPGDLIIVSGPIGDHGIAVLSARGDLGFEANVSSDIAPLNKMVVEMLYQFEDSAPQSRAKHIESYRRHPDIHVLRDPTRGGLAASLNEIARQSDVGVIVHETQIPVRPSVSAACEILGFDPLYIANEGKLIAVVAREDADLVLDRIRNHPYGESATIIGEVIESPKGRVLMKTAIGSTRVIDMPGGELLPRIC